MKLNILIDNDSNKSIISFKKIDDENFIKLIQKIVQEGIEWDVSSLNNNTSIIPQVTEDENYIHFTIVRE